MSKIIKKYSPNFTKLRFEFSSKIQKSWAGDWNIQTNTIKIHKGLNNIDRRGVIIHEFIEMMVTGLMNIPEFPHPDYDQKIHGKKNKQAHNYANKIEKEILEMTGINWEQHEKRVNKIRHTKTK